MINRAATIKDVAKRAGVSVSTVSRVMSASPNVREATRARVLQIIAELNFQPSAIARGLVSQRTKTLGVVVSNISDPFYPQVIRGVDDAAHGAGYTIILMNTDDDLERNASALEVLRSHRVGGIVLGSARLDDPSVRDLIRTDTPVVLVNRGMRRVAVSQVTINNRRGAELATEHLIALGHRRLLHLAGPRFAQNAADRAVGFRRAARRAGISEADARVLWVGFHPAAARSDEIVLELLSMENPFTGILAVDDVVAAHTMELAAFELGLEIPADLAVVGFDDSYLAASRFVHLTTVSHRGYEMGATAGRLLVDRAEGAASRWPVKTSLEPHLIVRGSTDPDATHWSAGPTGVEAQA